MTNYSRGAAFERKIKKEYEEQGFFVVRAAGSRGPVDLVAIKPRGNIVCIQCKLRKPTKKEREAAVAFADSYDLQIVLLWPDGRLEY